MNTDSGSAYHFPLVEHTKTNILELYNRKQDPNLVFHNYGFAIALWQEVVALSERNRVGKEASEVAQIAALFMPLGYLYNYTDFLRYSRESARQFLAAQKYDTDKITRVLQAMQTVGNQSVCATVEEQLLNDAFHITAYLRDGEEKSTLRKLERELVLEEKWDKATWLQQQKNDLISVRLLTYAGKVEWEKVKSRLLSQVNNRLEKRLNREEEVAQVGTRFQGLEPAFPNRATQTFFRSNYRNHINLSAIADQKANIMISVNAILISVLITFLSYRNIGETNPKILLPVIIFIVTGLVSLIFAVLSARPKVTALNNKGGSLEEIRKNIVFFGNFVTLNLEQFEEAMDAMLRDSELMYGNMTRDLYFLGKVLEKKYRFLSVSYNIFMIGFIATVVTFLIALFT